LDRRREGRIELRARARAVFTAYLPTRFLNTADGIKLIIELIVFLIVYLEGAPMIGAINLADINSLRTVFSVMGTITKMLNIPLRAVEKAAKIKTPNKK
jgi:hypothetical protein